MEEGDRGNAYNLNVGEKEKRETESGKRQEKGEMEDGAYYSSFIVVAE